MVNLSEIRNYLNKTSEDLIKGIEARAHYPLSQGLFAREFRDGENLLENYPQHYKMTPLRGDGGFKKRILAVYLRTLANYCPKGEATDDVEKILDRDKKNLSLLVDRIVKGQLVAQAKYEINSGIIYLEPEGIRIALINKEREREVIAHAVKTAGEVGITRPSMMQHLFRDIIELTLDVEIDYIKQIRLDLEKSTPRTGIGFGQVPKRTGTNAKGWGSAL